MPIIKLVVGYAVNAWLLTLLAVIGIYSIVGMTYLVLGAPVPSLGFDTVVGVLLSPLAAGIALVDRLPSGLVLFVLGCGVGYFIARARYDRARAAARSNTISALVLVLMLGVLSQAAAECAWVLWAKYELVNVTPGRPIDSDGWGIEAAVPTYAVCNEAAKKRAQRHAEPEPSATNATAVQINEMIGGGFFVRKNLKSPEHASTSVTFRCLPETVDPRAPKGGGR